MTPVLLEVAAASEVGGGVEIQALCDIAVAQADLGATDVAAATFEQAGQAALVYEEDVYRASLYQMIAKAQTDSGDAAGALAAAEAQSMPLMKAASLIGVAQGMLEHSQRKAPPTED